MHVMALDSAAPCFVDFLPVPHNNLAELRYTVMRYQAPLASRLFFYEDACRDAVSDDSSELVSHQMALSEARLEPFLLNSPRDLQPGLRGFFPFGTTTVFGPYGNSFFEFTHYAFGGGCATSAIRTLALHFGFGAEQVCSAAARVTSSLPISGVPFNDGFFSAWLLLRGVSSLRGSLPVDHPLVWSTRPSSLRTCSLRHSPMRGGHFFWGRRTCFPSAVFFSYGHRLRYAFVLVYAFRGVRAYRGSRTCFPTADEYVAEFTFLYFFPFLVHVFAVRV